MNKRMTPLLLLLALITGCEQPATDIDKNSAAHTDESVQTADKPKVAPIPRAVINEKGIQLPAYTEVTLDNGILLLMTERRDVPLVSFSAIVRNGVVSEPADKGGVANLTARLLQKGAGDRDELQFAQDVAAVGGELSAAGGVEATIINGEFMSRDFDFMIEVLSDMLMRPALDQDEFDKLKTRSIQSLAAAKDSDLRALNGVYGKSFLHGDHPYGRAVSGDETSLAGITHGDVASFYADQYGADRMILTLAGDFDSAAAQERIEQALGSWRKAGSETPGLAAPETQKGRRVLLVDKPDATQTYFWIGNVGVSHSDAQMPAIDLVNTVFGGRFTSILMYNLRTKAGLTYGARSTQTQLSKPGSVAIVSFTKTETTIEAMDMALDLLGQLHQDGLDDDILHSAKAYRLGLFPLGLETNSQLAAALGQLRFYGEPDEKINAYGPAIAAVNTDDAKDVIARVFPPVDDVVFVLIGNAADIRDGIAKYGDVTEIAITHPSFKP